MTDKVSGALAQVAKQFTRSQTAADALQKRLNSIHSLYKSGMMMMGGGMALAAPLVAATKSAMTLESAMARVKIQTGATGKQMEMLNNTFNKTSNETGIFSKPTLARFASEMYSGGITNVNQINSLLPIMAKAADVTKLMSGGRVNEMDTLHTLTALSHQFGKYDTKSMTDISNAAVAMSLQLPGGMKSLLGTGSTVNVPGNRMLGIDPTTLMAFQAAVAQTSGSAGAGGKGRMSAANQVNALMRGLPGIFGAGLLSGKSAFAGAVLGLSDRYGASTIMKNGKMDFLDFQKKLAGAEGSGSLDIAKRMKTYLPMLGKKAGDLQPLVDRAIATGGKGVDKKQLMAMVMTYMFGSASTIATLIGDPKFMAAQNRMKTSADKAIKENAISKMQAKIMETLDGQVNRLQTAFGTLGSTIGMQLIPVATQLAKTVADVVYAINDWATANPKIVRLGAVILGAASAALMLGGAINIISAGFSGLKFVLPVVTKALGPVSLGIAALALVIDHWGDIMKFVNQHSGFFLVQASRLADVMDMLGKVAKSVGDFIGNAISFIGSKLANIPGFKAFSENISKMLTKFLTPSDKEVNEAKKKLLASGHADWIQGIQGKTGVTPGQVNIDSSNLKALISGTGSRGPASISTKDTYNYSPHIEVKGATLDEVDQKLQSGFKKLVGAQERAKIRNLNGASNSTVNRGSFANGMGG
ncbi:MAG: phage tail tape measure protein [Cyanobacteria bacterium REEB67]|nr:phage tail tape measure protein [Cyanobacteria bacterium REEB67]